MLRFLVWLACLCYQSRRCWVISTGKNCRVLNAHTVHRLAVRETKTSQWSAMLSASFWTLFISIWQCTCLSPSFSCSQESQVTEIECHPTAPYFSPAHWHRELQGDKRGGCFWKLEGGGGSGECSLRPHPQTTGPLTSASVHGCMNMCMWRYATECALTHIRLY